MNQATRDKFWLDVQSKIWPDLDGSEREQLGTILTSQAFKHALGIVWEEAKGTSTEMLTINLSSPEGLNQAARLQGKALGMTRVIEALIDLVEDEEGEDDE